ncbi:MAG: hypothetical protein ILP11_04685 [Alphaproteobacteria bacterium]|nr:hypothetical protein [Alphaproteobacteria bacterium]
MPKKAKKELHNPMLETIIDARAKELADQACADKLNWEKGKYQEEWEKQYTKIRLILLAKAAEEQEFSEEDEQGSPTRRGKGRRVRCKKKAQKRRVKRAQKQGQKKTQVRGVKKAQARGVKKTQPRRLKKHQMPQLQYLDDGGHQKS